MRLCDALGVQRGEIVAFIGAGGKTSAMAQLARELAQENWRVLVTMTTRLAKDELAAFPYAVSLKKITTYPLLSELLNRYRIVVLYHHLKGDKVIGISPDLISEIADNLDSDAILIEADGSRRLPLKAPYEHEPVIPSDASLVVPVAGMDAVGKPFVEGVVYNIAPIIERYGFPYGMPIQAPWIAQILRDEALGLSRIPERVRIVPLLNKAGESTRDHLRARRTAQIILQEKRVHSVAIGAVQNQQNPIREVQRRIAAVVLAGGLSSRMGRSKPLLPWGDQTVIEAIARRLMLLRFSDVVVVTGHQSEAVQAALKEIPVRTIYNPDYATGEMLSSFKVGLRALDDSLSACMVFLGDQPQISPRLVHELLTAYADGKGKIVAPSYRNRRGHPILIDRRHWREILDLPPGAAPRDVINAYNDEIAYILTDDASILADMDTPEEYQAALKRAGLL
jgi:molybdenum cofactor cytidylyltransferase